MKLIIIIVVAMVAVAVAAVAVFAIKSKGSSSSSGVRRYDESTFCGEKRQVVVKSWGSNKIVTVKTIRIVTGVDLRTALSIAEGARPTDEIAVEIARDLIAEIEKVGGQAELI